MFERCRVLWSLRLLKDASKMVISLPCYLRNTKRKQTHCIRRVSASMTSSPLFLLTCLLFGYT